MSLKGKEIRQIKMEGPVSHSGCNIYCQKTVDQHLQKKTQGKKM